MKILLFGASGLFGINFIYKYSKDHEITAVLHKNLLDILLILVGLIAWIFFELQKREQESEKLLDNKTDIGWGHQIRSYVLQPYQLVKDLRNKKESSNPLKVLDGDIDEFLEEGIKTPI